MPKTKTYWKSTEELENKDAFIEQQEKEFAEKLPVDKFLGDESLSDSSTSRRDFLKFLGFSVGAATLAACEGPVHKAVPYLNKPEEITPGVANWYASTYVDGRDYCSVLVKTREGRPIHVEGNAMSAVTKGAVNARVQGSVLPLYDSGRYKAPSSEGEETSWSKIDGDIGAKLDAIRNNGGTVRVLSSSLASSSTRAAVHEFLSSFQPAENAGSEVEAAVDARHIVYDAVSSYGIRKANAASFGKAVVPSYHFEKARTIVSVGADFLSNWVAPIQSMHQYGESRKVGEEMSKHIQFEANLSMTGSNADTRIPVKPSQYGAILANIYNEIAKLLGRPPIPAGQVSGEMISSISDAASHLLQNKGKSVLITGSNNPNHQVIANGVNDMIGSYGKTIDLDNPNLTLQSDDAAVAELIADMNAGKVDALILYNVNPVYSLPNAEEFKAGLAKVGTSISFAGAPDETTALVGYICPDHHYLESWNDANPKPGHYSLGQPTISPLGKTRQAQDSLLKWAGVSSGYEDFIKKYWKENIFTKQTVSLVFTSFWNQSLHDGVVTVSAGSVGDSVLEVAGEESGNSFGTVLTAAAQSVQGETSEGDWELQMYEKTGIGDGTHANNPWLQELPDPVSKVCWDNYLTMNPDEMKDRGFNTVLGQVQEADLVEVTVNGVTQTLPVYPQYGQTKGTLGLALGYGRTSAGKTGTGIGQNAYALCSFGDHLQYQASDVTVSGSVGKYQIATTQTHHTMMGRAPVRATTLDEFMGDPKAGNPDVTIASSDHKQMKADELNLWQDFDRPGHHWGMSIDLNACIGCGACVVGCGSENNVSVVGKDEVARSREMQWIRIDRYYSSDTDKHGSLNLQEIPSSSENLEVSFQPIMCQHCNHAPCETVCPVAATTHSNDGLNQMAYNRCVGTKFCQNNCPYKVRRFNWFSYQNDSKFANVNPAQDDMGRMVLNPDVVVRSRGVMEKCSMCIQRIQSGKLVAKKEGRRIVDGEFQTACAAACPTHAITFGDKNDPESQVSKNQADPRSYFLLEELDVQPTVNYMTKVRNKKIG